MNINFHSFSIRAISFFKENILPSLTDTQKKIYAVAALAIGILVAILLIKRDLFINKYFAYLKKDVKVNPYLIPIQNLKNNKLPVSDFTVKDVLISEKNNITEFLVEYHSKGNPEIKALWDEEKAKLYLVGGKIDAPVKIAHNSFKTAKANQARIQVNFNELNKKGEIQVLKRNPGTYTSRFSPIDGYSEKQQLPPSDEIITTVIIK